MFQVRSEQLESLTKAQLAHANRALGHYARQRFPVEFANTSEAAMTSFVVGVREAANSYGVQQESDVATFLDLTVMYGSEFPAAEWAADCMACRALSGSEKIAALRKRLRKSGLEL